MNQDYELVIGLEVHAQLKTNSKIFSAASAKFGGDPNTHIDPLTLGLPGALPVANQTVIDSAITLGLALQCEISRENRFARKHYFYPDLPKGYQTSQFAEPICGRGHLEIVAEKGKRTIGITRIHMEEDAGKNIHDSLTESSLIDLNRAGVPLLEIVTEPDLRSADEAASFLRKIRQIIRYTDVGDGNMDEGSMRCDANISLRPRGSMQYGTRTEIKNLNSFKFVEKAIHYEAARQLKLLKAGEKIVQETRLFNSSTETTHSMRGKEGAADYRYFPCPDLPPLKISEAKIATLKKQLPLLPTAQAAEFVEKYGLTEYEAELISAERERVEYYQTAQQIADDPKTTCNWMTTELFAVLNKKNLSITESPVSASDLGTLVKRIGEKVISGKMAKEIFAAMIAEAGTSPDQIIEERGLKQISDPAEISRFVDTVLAQSENQLEKYLGGNEKLFGYFVGQTLKASNGKADPEVVNKLLKEELAKRKQAAQ